MSTVEEKIAAAIDRNAPPAGLVRAALACMINPGDCMMSARSRLEMADEILGRVLPEPPPSLPEPPPSLPEYEG